MTKPKQHRDTSISAQMEFTTNPLIHDGVKLTEAEFQIIKRLVYQRFGINLSGRHRRMIVSRFQKRLKKMGFTNFSKYIRYIKLDQSGEALSEFINTISTNFSYFYREKGHFQFLRTKVLPTVEKQLGGKRQKDLRLWCAGCATGEEAYTLAIVLREYFQDNYAAWKAGLLATDISKEALNFAAQGVYPKDRLQHIPIGWHGHYIKPVNQEEWAVNDMLKQDITYRRLNLLSGPYPFKAPFHIIFCRNVMIYFNENTKTQIVDWLVESLAPGGFLFIGHSETIDRKKVKLDYVAPSVYQKR